MMSSARTTTHRTRHDQRLQPTALGGSRSAAAEAPPLDRCPERKTHDQTSDQYSAAVGRADSSWDKEERMDCERQRRSAGSRWSWSSKTDSVVSDEELEQL